MSLEDIKRKRAQKPELRQAAQEGGEVPEGYCGHELGGHQAEARAEAGAASGGPGGGEDGGEGPDGEEGDQRRCEDRCGEAEGQAGQAREEGRAEGRRGAEGRREAGQALRRSGVAKKIVY